MNDLPRIVIVGAGTAGMCSAERLRELGFDGEIVIIGAESSLPVYRPALTKQYLTGELGLKDIVTAPAEDLGATWRLNTSVSQLDPQRRVVHLPGGEELEYDGLVIASGVEARRLPGGVNGRSRVSVLRSVADSRALRQALASSAEQVVVIGTGFIGCELASSIRSLRRDVTIVGRSSRLMDNVLDGEMSRRLTDLHRRNHVRLHLSASVREWSRGPSRVELLLTNGTTLSASWVVVAAGSVPAVSWLRDSGAQLDNGIVCEPTCHVAGMEDVVAAGDVASWPNLRFDTKPRRVEHWTNAIEMGRAAAESLLSGRATATPFMPVPRFWSEQHQLRIQAAGMPAVGVEHRPIGAGSGGQYLTGYYRDDELTGVIGFDNSVEVMSYAAKFMNKPRIDVSEFRREADSESDSPRRGRYRPTQLSVQRA